MHFSVDNFDTALAIELPMMNKKLNSRLFPRMILSSGNEPCRVRIRLPVEKPLKHITSILLNVHEDLLTPAYVFSSGLIILPLGSIDVIEKIWYD